MPQPNDAILFAPAPGTPWHRDQTACQPWLTAHALAVTGAALFGLRDLDRPLERLVGPRPRRKRQVAERLHRTLARGRPLERRRDRHGARVPVVAERDRDRRLPPRAGVLPVLVLG